MNNRRRPGVLASRSAAHAASDERVMLVDEYDKPLLDNITQQDMARQVRVGKPWLRLAERVTARDAQAQQDHAEPVARREAQRAGLRAGLQRPGAVAAETLLVIATPLTQATNDQQQVEPILKELDKLPERWGAADTLLADNGSFSQAHVMACLEQGMTPLIALGGDRHQVPLAERLAPGAAPVSEAARPPSNRLIRVDGIRHAGENSAVRRTENARHP